MSQYSKSLEVQDPSEKLADHSENDDPGNLSNKENSL
jgi:hypothetical protein